MEDVLSVPFIVSCFYKITKIVRALWLAEGRGCMTLRCFAFRALIRQARTRQVYTLFTQSFVGWNLENLYKQAVTTFFARKIAILEIIFLQNKNWSRVQDSVYKTLRLVRISLLIGAITKSFAFFSRESHFIKATENLFSCVCMAWYKHSRGWENSQQLCKPSTSSQVCINREL